ncbi:MAG: hypothetical protein HYV65_02920 [Candidatus Spechtbacteria bacterium]|nr:hypothetical protein [Candidatus Spechtbacteria bacterium]
MQIRAINFLMSEGLGFWKVLDTESGRAECNWLIASFAQNRVTHVIIPTESINYPASGYSLSRLQWLVGRVQASGMIAVVWGDKLRYFSSSGIDWWGQIVDAFGSSIVYNLSQEIDILWVDNDARKSIIISNLTQAVNYLVGRGISRDSIWAGGGTREGTIAIAKAGVGVLTYTMYRDVQGALNVKDAPQIPLAENVLTGNMRIIKALTNLPLLLVEFGHYTTWGGEILQRDVLALCIRAAQNAGCIGTGLWLWLDLWNCDGPAGWCAPDNNSYGVIRNDGGSVMSKLAFTAVVQNW